MRVGALRIPVRIEKPVNVTRSSGQQTTTWDPLEERSRDYAEIRPLTGAEFLRSQEIMGETTARIRMRFRNDLDETMRIVDLTNQQVWLFKSPPLDPNGKRLTTEIVAIRG